MTGCWSLRPDAIYLICKSFIRELSLFLFLLESLHWILFEVLCSQLQTECPNKGLWRKCMYTALTFWPAAQLLAFSAVRVCMWHVCVFAAELTQLWPWHSLCWILLQVECRNYIRTLHRMNDTTIYVCGTNAFSPTCDYLVSIPQNTESVQRKCFNPSLASTYLCFCVF